jgi:hypothetical protein
MDRGFQCELSVSAVSVMQYLTLIGSGGYVVKTR